MSVEVIPMTLITDCVDPNALARVNFRLSTLCPKFRLIQVVPVASDLEAAGNLVDLLDAAEGRRGAILVNVAPRNGHAKKWSNGSPFGYFRVSRTVVVATIDGLTLSLAKKVGLVSNLKVLDTASAVEQLVALQELAPDKIGRVIATQFRSFEFLPRVAKVLALGKELEGEVLPLSEIQDAPKAIFWQDNFGNLKTTVLPDELPSHNGHVQPWPNQSLPFFYGLRQVPDNQPAVIVGSSGFGQNRFLEVVVQGASAATWFNLKSGDPIFA